VDADGSGDKGLISARVVWAIEGVRFLDDHCERLRENGSRRGTLGQLVEVPVEVQLAKNFWVGIWERKRQKPQP